MSLISKPLFIDIALKMVSNTIATVFAFAINAFGIFNFMVTIKNCRELEILVRHKRHYENCVGGGGGIRLYGGDRYNIYFPVPDSYKSEFFLRTD